MHLPCSGCEDSAKDAAILNVLHGNEATLLQQQSDTLFFSSKSDLLEQLRPTQKPT